MTTIRHVRQQLDPCKKFVGHDPNLLLSAMGTLPKCLFVQSTASFLDQVCKACDIIFPEMHNIGPYISIDADGQYQYGEDKGVVYPIGVMSRIHNGDYEAIYFYANGDVIVVQRSNNYRLHMDG